MVISLLRADRVPVVHSSHIASLLTAARLHRVELAVLDKLVGLGVELPTAVAEHHAGERSRRRTTRLLAARALTTVQDKISVPFVVLKGPAVAARWYDDPNQRSYGDVDILIRRQDFRAGFEALVAAGFESQLANWHGFARHGVAEVPLRRDGIDIDLHWDVVALASDRETIRFGVDEMLGRAVPVSIVDRVVPTLDDVDTLIHLCVNEGLDGAHRLQHLLDIHRIVTTGALDGNLLVERARRWGAAAICAAVLQRCRSVMGTNVPERWLQELEPWNGWLLANRVADRSARRLVAHDSLAPGVVLSAGRSSQRATLAAVRRNSIDSIRTRVRGRRTDAGGDLDWQRQPPDDCASSSQRTYLDWVDRGDQLRIVRRFDAERLEALFQEHEPRSTPLIGAALSEGLDGRRVEAHVVERPDGRPIAALVAYRWTVGGRTGYPLVLDEAAAVSVASLVDRLNITDLAGFEQDLRPLRPLLSRWMDETPSSAATLPAGFRWGPPPPGTRRAGSDDIDEITDLMWRHSPHGFANRWLLRQRVRRAIRQLIIVAEAGDPPRIVGVGARDSATSRFHCWAHIVIDPAWREQRLSWDLVAAGAAIAEEAGVGLLGFAVSSNPMPIPDDTLLPDTWLYVSMAAPGKRYGQRSLRAAADIVLQIGARGRAATPQEFRSAGSSDTLVSERRTQDWWSRQSATARDQDGE